MELYGDRWGPYSESTVACHSDGARTQVAPAVGGPHDGKLIRADVGVRELMFPRCADRNLMLLEYDVYHLVLDRRFEWRFDPMHGKRFA